MIDEHTDTPGLPLKQPYMAGWKTWAAVIGLGLLGLVDFMDGHVEPALTKLTAALGLLGVAHKIEKSGRNG